MFYPSGPLMSSSYPHHDAHYLAVIFSDKGISGLPALLHVGPALQAEFLSDPVPTRRIGGGIEGNGGRMREGTELDCIAAYCLLRHSTVSSGMKGGQNEEGRAIWKGACSLDRT